MSGSFESALEYQLATVKVLNGKGFGSGIVLDVAQGIIATCAHVVSSLNSGTVGTFLHGEAIPYTVIDRGFEDANDVAILKADLSSMRDTWREIFTLRTSVIVSGEPIMLCGFPYLLGDKNLNPVLTSGIVSTFPMSDQELIIVSALLSPGNSGGPCFDGEGRLLGLAKAQQLIGHVEVLTDRGKELRQIPSNYGFIVPIDAVVALTRDNGITLNAKREGT